MGRCSKTLKRSDDYGIRGSLTMLFIFAWVSLEFANVVQSLESALFVAQQLKRNGLQTPRNICTRGTGFDCMQFPFLSALTASSVSLLFLDPCEVRVRWTIDEQKTLVLQNNVNPETLSDGIHRDAKHNDLFVS
jgi:hypothetical protein